MKCAKCGAEIRPGCVYCSNCGQEAQIVTEINILEDDLLRSMLDEESEKTKETVSAEDKCRKSSESSDTKQAERGRKQKKSRLDFKMAESTKEWDSILKKMEKYGTFRLSGNQTEIFRSVSGVIEREK